MGVNCTRDCGVSTELPEDQAIFSSTMTLAKNCHGKRELRDQVYVPSQGIDHIHGLTQRFNYLVSIWDITEGISQHLSSLCVGWSNGWNCITVWRLPLPCSASLHYSINCLQPNSQISLFLGIPYLWQPRIELNIISSFILYILKWPKFYIFFFLWVKICHSNDKSNKAKLLCVFFSLMIMALVLLLPYLSENWL